MSKPDEEKTDLLLTLNEWRGKLVSTLGTCPEGVDATKEYHHAMEEMDYMQRFELIEQCWSHKFRQLAEPILVQIESIEQALYKLE